MNDKPEYRRSWADVKDFVKARVRRASTDEDYTRAKCLYAHYRRWAFLTGSAPVSEEVFDVRFSKLTKLEPASLNGHRVYAAEVFIEEPIEAEDVDERAHEPKVRGRVRAKEPMVFRFDAIEAGDVLDWMEPTPFERDYLQAEARKELSASMSYLVVRFNGTRRYVPGKFVEKVYE